MRAKLTAVDLGTIRAAAEVENINNFEREEGVMMQSAGMASKEGPPPVGILLEDFTKRVAAIRQALANLETALQPVSRPNPPTENEAKVKQAHSGSQMRALLESHGQELDAIYERIQDIHRGVDL